MLKMLVHVSRRPAGARDRHVHRLLRARDGRGAARGRPRGGLRDRRRRRAASPGVFRRVRRRAQDRHRVGPALDTLRGLAGGSRLRPDLHRRRQGGLPRVPEHVLDCGLLAPHGLVCVDNTLMQGQPWTAGEPTANGVAIHAFNRAVAADPRVEQVIIPLRDGLTLIRRGLTPRSMRSPTSGPDRASRSASCGSPTSTRRWRRGCAGCWPTAVCSCFPDKTPTTPRSSLSCGPSAPCLHGGRDAGAGFRGSQRGQQRRTGTPPRSLFHVDTSYVRRPPAYTALRAVRLPERGGETVFTDQYRAYETLPADVRERLRGRTIRHVVDRAAARCGRRGVGRAPRFPPAPPLRAHRALHLDAEAVRRDQRAGAGRGGGDDRLPDRALHARGQPLPAPRGRRATS